MHHGGRAPRLEKLPPLRWIFPKVRVSPEEGSSTESSLLLRSNDGLRKLTSDLNYDELLNFFLTYRTYINAVDLCHLFICRFHWSLGQHSSSQDETVRRIVRVRTFVAIRYWLLTFFNVDFLPELELRLSLGELVKCFDSRSYLEEA